jgi:pimeloyl-ACP methyl ester carboxylesterase
VGEDWLHQVVSRDGTMIAGRVRGDGPPLVVVHGGLGDGNPDTDLLVPHLVQHFTCYCISTRGRGVSGDAADHSRERMYEDVAAFVEGIGTDVSVFAHSSGGAWALGGGARVASQCRALALYEPALPVTRAVVRDDTYARLIVAEAEGRLTDCAWISFEEIIEPTDDERAFFAIPGVAELTARVINPMTLSELPELNRPTTRVVLEQLTMPVLLLHGSEAGQQWKAAVRSLEETLPDPRVVEIPDAGHLGPVTHAEAVADALVSFFKA